VSLKVKDICFYVIPAMVGILIIIFTAINAFSETACTYKEVGWIFFWTFLGLVLIAHTIISILTLCRKE
jgi:hypothetical protein